MSIRYKKSEELLKRALHSIPLGTQTFSKSLTQYPQGVSPFFIERGQGARVWDVDENEYIDFTSALASVNLGYCDKDIDEAVIKQLSNGVSFSLPHILETEVAELIISTVPCAEMVRFAKNGSDATSGAIRISRAYTKREHIIVCGYHGWQDWYIGVTTRDEGVPKSTKELTHQFVYNDINSLKEIFLKYEDQIAAVIMEPMNVEYPKDGFLEEVKKITHENGALLIFDETITGFRYSNGGAQEFFNVIPDLATFGKGIANGFPLSAIVGEVKIMSKMEDVFFSGTFGGETLSLAAAKAAINKIVKDCVVEKNIKKGEYLLENLQRLIEKFSLENIFETKGHPSWSFTIMKEYNDITTSHWKTLFLQVMHKNGILTLGSHNLSYSHTISDIDKLLESYESFFYIAKDIKSLSDLDKVIECDYLRPLFKVR